MAAPGTAYRRRSYGLDSFDPNSHSSKATRLTILASQSLTSTRRQHPHRQHRSSAGRCSALTMPMWPHCWHEILSIIGAFALGGGNEKAPGNPSSGG
jgi:hypothetical protein